MRRGTKRDAKGSEEKDIENCKNYKLVGLIRRKEKWDSRPIVGVQTDIKEYFRQQSHLNNSFLANKTKNLISSVKVKLHLTWKKA